jgi:hypothetical protein
MVYARCFHYILAMDDIRMEFAEAAGSNFVNHLPYSHVPYFSKKS